MVEQRRKPRPLLPRGERVLISAHDSTRNRQVVATRCAVYHQGDPRELEPWHRLGWDQIDRADWDAGRGELTFVRTTASLVVRLTGEHRFVELARERIAATTLLHVRLHRFGRPAGWLTARRRADGRGDVHWTLCSDGVRWTADEVAQAIRKARVQAGL
ncbi:hypothetical protein ACQP2Y_16915 [Actinoplanes sp. CA-051413]|uniref:hypothetical protein n=1 Tax=Actinoplanes sp. CA-051413 TaxID=3239899 RepID=UPI003D966670